MEEIGVSKAQGQGRREGKRFPGTKREQSKKGEEVNLEDASKGFLRGSSGGCVTPAPRTLTGEKRDADFLHLGTQKKMKKNGNGSGTEEIQLGEDGTEVHQNAGDSPFPHQGRSARL